MAVFNELLNIERMEDPEERKAEDLRRGKKKTGKFKKSKETSVSLTTYRATMFIVRLLLVLAVLGAAVFLAWYLITLFIPA